MVPVIRAKLLDCYKVHHSKLPCLAQLKRSCIQLSIIITQQQGVHFLVVFLAFRFLPLPVEKTVQGLSYNSTKSPLRPRQLVDNTCLLSRQLDGVSLKKGGGSRDILSTMLQEVLCRHRTHFVILRILPLPTICL